MLDLPDYTLAGFTILKLLDHMNNLIGPNWHVTPVLSVIFSVLQASSPTCFDFVWKIFLHLPETGKSYSILLKYISLVIKDKFDSGIGNVFV